MPNLYTPILTKISSTEGLTDEERFSVLYHNIFDYPLTLGELIKWSAGKLVISHQLSAVSQKNGYFFLEGKEGLIYKKLLRKRISKKKLEIAKRASKILSLIPSVKMIGVTGALSMDNAGDESDIDLMIITSGGFLWTTRLLVYFLLLATRHSLRRPGDKVQKDKLCLNMWLDESDLSWKKQRNVYTAHEIAQVVPLVNKDETYEKFLYKNKWILKYWPNSVRIIGLQDRVKSQDSSLLSLFLIPFEKLAFKIQYLYMKSKITCEVVTPTRALFHPIDWSKVIRSRFA